MYNLNWEVKISYSKELENGKVKTVSEQYIVKASTLTEIDVLMNQEFGLYDDFKIAKVQECKISEIIYNNKPDSEENSYWKGKVYFYSIDEKNGSEKKTKHELFIRAISHAEATNVLEEGMKGTMSTYTIGGINETPFLEVLSIDGERSVEEDDEE